MDHRTRPIVVALSVAASALVLAGCTSVVADPGPTSATTPSTSSDGTSATAEPSGSATSRPGSMDWDPVGPVAAQPVAAQLAAFDSCDGLLDYYVDAADDLVGPWGLGGGPMMYLDDTGGMTEMAAGDADGSARGAQPTSVADTDVSGTNVQEEGVDEPDIVKTDGDVIVTVATGALRVVDVASSEVVGRLALPEDAWGSELLLAGDDLLVLSTGAQAWRGPAATDDARFPAFAPTRTTLTRVDLSDPAAPTVTGAVRLEGAYRSARMVDGTVRLVLVSDPSGLSFVQPTDSGLSAEQEAEAANRRILAESDLDDWVPHLQVLDGDGRGVGDVAPILDCVDIAHPAEPSGLSTVSVLTFAIDGDDVVPSSGAGLVAAGDTVYASTDRLLVTTSPWGQWIQPFVDRLDRPGPAEVRTDIHSFDIGDPSATTYVGSGSVAGTLIGQFALSEAAGVIRVATTTEPSWWGGDGDEASESALVMLAERDGELVETGRVDGLGVTERIQAVRYLGPDVAAIVTFRQTDPLYLVDTSDPSGPVVTGELKIPGFSAYLHPLGDGRLLGVGQDADVEDGATLGLQVSLFDVSDLADPQRIDQVTFGQGSSMVEYDHRAFLHWAPTGQVVLPAELWDEDGLDQVQCVTTPCPAPTMPFMGAVVLQVDGSTVVEQGRVTPRDDGSRDWWGQASRSMVIGDHLWVLSEDRLTRVTLDGLDDRTVVALR